MKYRIVEHGHLFYPEYRFFYLWCRMNRMKCLELGNHTHSANTGIGFFYLDQARKSLAEHIAFDVKTIHSSEKRMKDE